MSKILLLVAVIAVIQTAFAEEATATATAPSGAYAQPGEITLTYDKKFHSAEVNQLQVTETFVSKAEADRLAAELVQKKEQEELVLREAAVKAALKFDEQKRAHDFNCAKYKQDCRDEEVKAIDNNFKTATENWVNSNRTYVEISVPSYTKCVEGESISNKATADSNSKVRQSTEKCLNHGKRVFDEAKSAKQTKCSELSSKLITCSSPKEQAKSSWETAKQEVQSVQVRLSAANVKLQAIKEAGLKMYETSCESSDKCDKSYEFTNTKNNIKLIEGELVSAQKRESDANAVYSALPECYSQKSESDSCNAELDQFNSCNSWSDNVLRNHDDVVSFKSKEWKSQCGSSPVEPRKPERFEFETAQKSITTGCLADAGKRGSIVGDAQKTCDPQPESIETLRNKLGLCNLKTQTISKEACDAQGYSDNAPKGDIASLIKENWKVLTGALIFFFTAFWFIGSGHSEEAPRRSKAAAAPVDVDSADADEDESAGSDAPSTANKGSRKRSSTPTKKK